ncbi:MAG: NADH dehydrogenase [Betaproteobacteria bacterium SG8_40]|jgi:NADH-quinone oxidoreductase subunit G|nr:MAG: NADH dehydrogenase [Betaproteobacteria bacterium SG8_40]
MITLEIDGKTVEVAEHSTVMDAANKLGIYVPHFCYHKKLSIAANCRMCLVQVEKAPKPLPACATPVTEGMKVWTHSELAINAQKAVMEFLLINHPLDCPICDQGGECQLQDLAVGYGGSSSRFHEGKRVVGHKDLGPLVSAEEMSRCIHCTRCVRFGQEIAGIMELGMAGRGEHSEIMAFVGHTVDSELSGNMIDVCPVGALTSKPFRYSARTWELSRRRSVSPHDSLGSNLVVQVKQNRVMRVLPRENEDVNECWLSDRDRFSYEGLTSKERLTTPMVKRDGRWQEVDWATALEYVTSELSRLREAHGPAALGALATAQATSEEFFLLQKLLRSMGSDNVDFRLRQLDFSGDVPGAGIPWLGMKVADLNNLDRVLLIGSNVRKEHPLLAQRIRQAVRKNGSHLNVINSVGDDLLVRTHGRAIVAPGRIADTIAAVAKAAAERAGVSIAPQIAQAVVDDNARQIAESLAGGDNKAILLGNLAQQHPQWSHIRSLANLLASIVGGRVGVLVDGANTMGGYLCGAVPGGASSSSNSSGRNARDMISSPLKAYILLHAEPELDMALPGAALAAMQSAELVVAMSPYKHRALDYARVLLPVSPFTETAGTFVNLEGRTQHFNGVVPPLGDTRPAWKVLRVMGNLLQLDGFDYETIDDVRQQMADAIGSVEGRLDNKSHAAPDVSAGAVSATNPDAIERIGEVPAYHADGIVRRAGSLQQTRDADVGHAWMNARLIERLALSAGDRVRVSQDGGEAILTVARDDRLPDGCVRVAAANAATSQLGSPFGTVSVERLAAVAEVDS